MNNIPLEIPHEVKEKIDNHPDLVMALESKNVKLVNGYGRSKLMIEQVPANHIVTFINYLSEYIEEHGESIKERDERQYDRFISQIESLKEYKDVMIDKFKNKARNLRELVAKLCMLVIQSAPEERPWLYGRDNKTGMITPYLITDIYYQEPTSYDRSTYACINLAHVKEDKVSRKTVSINNDTFKLHKRDPLTIIEAQGYEFETPELYTEYTEQLKEFMVKREYQSVQVVDGQNKKYIADNLHYRKTNSRGLGRNEKPVFSEENLPVGTNNFISGQDLYEMPFYMQIYLFNLKAHKHEWVNSSSVELYKYDHEIVNKLVLPEDQKGLIEILLTNDFRDVGEDIIEGKGQATIILTKGEAGLGKTVTAEVFSELKELPLYSVHSGQLGTNGENIERQLDDILENAERWGCILLIDEADVYIRKRDNDVNHNAIVATFLRTLEYYKGTMFMTTNRVDDVDDAISSRCSAVLLYQKPEEDMSIKLWDLFCNKQFNLNISEEMVEELSQKIPNLAGRDIKNIVQLTARYLKGKKIEKAKIEYFMICATFRGLKSVTA